MDFSPGSIAYARERARAQGLDIDYRCQNYLEFAGEGGYDLALLIYCDFCALSPVQRAKLLARSSMACSGPAAPCCWTCSP